MKRTYLIDKTVHNGLKSRVHIRAYKSNQDMHTFLNKQTNNDWKVSTKENLKSGVYVFAGGQWHNVKSIDPSALAHM